MSNPPITPAPLRTVRLTRSTFGTAVEIVAAGRRVVYDLRRIGRAWELRREARTYRVHLGGDRATCTCPAHHYRPGHCKHISALLALARRGLLPEGQR